MGLRHLAMRGLTRGSSYAPPNSPFAWAVGLGLVAVCACDDAQPVDMAVAYLDSAVARRTVMEGSLAGVDNGYARLRREHYATGLAGDWERLPTWNPPVATLSAATWDATPIVTGAAPWWYAPAALEITAAAAAAEPEALRALGEAAFFGYPAQLLPATVSLTAAELEQYGLWRDDTHGVGGLVQAEMVDGSARLAMTCATCHANVRRGDAGLMLIPGLANSALNLGGWLADTADAFAAAPPGDFAPADTSALRGWGRGRVDVATVDGRLPVNIPDLRPTRWLTHLHYEADVAQQSIASLAVRLETLLITAHGQALRPPREVALGLATYLWSLAQTLPPPPSVSAGGFGAGAAAFRAACASCHAGTGLTGPPVDAARVGTDPTAAFAPERGTGRYRVPSLRGAGARGALMHDGSIGGLPALLDPGRLADAGAIRAHPFGLELDDLTRAALLDYLTRL